MADERGSLFLDFCRVVRKTRPRFFVMENVKGILSAALKHRPLDDRGAGFPPLRKEEQLGSALDKIQQELSKLGYYVVFGLLNAADFGVPQNRWRVFFIGSRDGEEIGLPEPTHGNPKKRQKGDGLRNWVTLKKALGKVKSKHWIAFTKSRMKLFRLLKPAQNWNDLPKCLHRKALGAALDSWGGRTGFCRRLGWDVPAPTLTTAPNGRATALCHPSKVRPLSVEEYAVLQQFPKNWKFEGSTSKQYIQIGNAVPLGLGEAIGRTLRRTMRITARGGLTPANYRRRGKVVCGDPALAERLKKRKRTQLHPRHLRKIKSIEAAKEWLRASA